MNQYINKYFNQAIKLNLARNCLRYIIRAYNIKQIFLPYYTCPIVWQSVKKENCEIKFYHIDNNFLPVQELGENDYIVYTNYFGICAKNVKTLASKYKNLIIDNAQAFFMPHCGFASFNSVRKFFGNTDGALLFCDKKLNENIEQDNSELRDSELKRRKNLSDFNIFTDFVNVDEYLINEQVKIMSDLTSKFLNTIDFEFEKQNRLLKFNYLHQIFSKLNKLNIALDIDDVPLYYPLMIENDSLRKKLQNNKISLEQFWSPINSKRIESIFQKYILPLPIDTRYSLSDTSKLAQIILNQI